ncbi:MAG: DUF4129 domain-containing protein [Myxococcaceae bacterium]
MSVVLALVLAACPAGERLPSEQRDAACAIDAQFVVTPEVEGLAAIYERPEFRNARASQASDLLKRLQRWLETVFETSEAETYSNLTRVLVLLLAAFVVIAVSVRFVGRRVSAKTLGKTQASASALELADPSVHLARAKALLGTDARAGAREGLLAILAALERKRLARPDRVKTNRELTKELPERGAPPELVEAVSAQLSWFDRAWYSLQPIDASSASAFLERASDVVAKIGAFGVERRA